MNNIIKSIMSLTVICFQFVVSAQDVKTYHLDTPGSLSTVVSESDYTMRKIKVTGNIDARDFFFIRDNLEQIASVDLSEAEIKGYSDEQVKYEEKAVPEFAFSSIDGDALIRLSAVQLPASVKSIGNSAFASCTSFSSINMEELKALEFIGNSSFSKCNKLRSLSFPASLQKIGFAAFSNCAALADITFPDDSRLSELGEQSFSECNNLTNINLSNLSLLEYIGPRAFSGCRRLNSFELPASVKVIGMESFMDCTGLQTVDMSKLCNLNVLEGSMFYNCTVLKSVKLPDSTEAIHSSAFLGCIALTSVKLPMGLKEIGDWTFSGCSALSEMECMSPAVPIVGYEAFSGVNPSNVTVMVNEDILNLYQDDASWNMFNLVGKPVSGIFNIEMENVLVERQGNMLSIFCEEPMIGYSIVGYDGRVYSSEERVSDSFQISLPSGSRYMVVLYFRNGYKYIVK